MSIQGNGGPRNVLVEYDDGGRAVVPFVRRLRRDNQTINEEES